MSIPSEESLKRIWTIPNIMSMVRLIMIPFIAATYFTNQEIIATLLIAISGVSDVIDGRIARRFNMVTNLGKILDPVADKCTQGIVLICLCYRYGLSMIALFCLYFIVEILMIYTGLVFIHKTNTVPMARWYGKLNTVVLYFVMGAFVLFPLFLPTVPVGNIKVHMLPPLVALILCIVCGCTITFALVMYMINYAREIKKATAEKKAKGEKDEPVLTLKEDKPQE